MPRLPRRVVLAAAVVAAVATSPAALAGGEAGRRATPSASPLRHAVRFAPAAQPALHVRPTASARPAAPAHPAAAAARAVVRSAPARALRPAADRSTQASYSGAGGSTDHGSQPAVFSAGPSTPVRADEDQAAVSVADGSGLPVAVEVESTDPSGAARSVVACGATGWIPVRSSTRVRVTVLTGTCADGTVSAPTSGTITVGFHRVPPRELYATPDRRWAVVIGIQHYGGRTHPTVGGDGDARAVRTALLRSGWMPSHILELRDGQATAPAVVRAMDWLVGHSSSRTFSVFHYSGHICVHTRGPCASGHTHLWTADNRFVPDTTVWAHLGRLRGHAWIDVAGCEAGAFGSHLASPLRLYTGSSQPTKTSYEEPDWRESVWTGLTWDQAYLQGAAGPAPLHATIGQMVAYGVRTAPELTANEPAGTQHPWVSGGSGSWRLSSPPGR